MSGRGWWHLAGRGDGGGRSVRAPAGALLPRGTLALGLDPSAHPEAAARLDLASGAPWHERLTLRRQQGGLALRHRVGATVGDLRLGPLRPAQEGSPRLTLTWDAPLRRLRLTVEDPSGGRLRQVDGTGAMPVGLAVLAPLLSGRPLPPGPAPVALSDREEPVGPRPGLPPDARLTTPEGPVAIAAIRPGMQVLTPDRGFRPVLRQGRVALPLAGPDRPVRLCAPFFGLEADLVVSPDLRLLLGGPVAEYLFGADEVLVAARHLADGHRAVPASGGVTRPG